MRVLLPPRLRLRRLGVLLFAAAVLGGCATSPVEQARQLSDEGRYGEALQVLAKAGSARGDDATTLRAEKVRVTQVAVLSLLTQSERAREAGRLPQARALIDQALALDPTNDRATTLARDIGRDERLDNAVARARDDAAAGRGERARTALEQVLREAPQNAAARELMSRLARPEPVQALPTLLVAALRKPVTLDFHDAPLRSIFEALARSHGLNFVFDKDVRADNRVTMSLHDIPLDEALHVLLTTQQLERQVLNPNTLLIYPATAAKQREHQSLVARTIYLTNADAKTEAAMVRQITKAQDVYVDERLNALIVRDSPAVVRMIEDLVAATDLPDAEVLIDVQVLEVDTTKVDNLGLQWPTQISYGATNADGTVPTSIPLKGLSLRGAIANPALVAMINASDGSTRTLANPTIRARNHEKAEVMVGDKLPVFTTTSTVNGSVTSSVAVTYIDVGVKLDVEPSVQLDNDVTIKLGLDVSNIVQQVTGPDGSVAYEVGTRHTTTTLRLRDGETQILAGMINNSDSSSGAGVPGLSTLPVAGALFGTHKTEHDKTEVVLLMTPHIVRNVPLPDARVTTRFGGTAGNAGAEPLRLSDNARAGVAAATGRSLVPPPPAVASAAEAEPAVAPAVLELATGGKAAVGDTVSVTLHNPTDYRMAGQLSYDSALLHNAAAGSDKAGPVAFDIAPASSVAIVFRVLPAAAGQATEVSAHVDSAATPGGLQAPGPVEVTGSGRIEVSGAH